MEETAEADAESVEGASPSISLRVTAMASGGEGVGRLEDGRVVFVDGGLPGDHVLLEDLKTRKKLARARIGRLLESSPDRVEPRCPHFGTRGGCQWQHFRYEGQLAAKGRMVRDALERIGGLALSRDIEIERSPDPYGYRARARLVESPGGLGYRIRGSREALTIEECPVLLATAQDGLAELLRSVAIDRASEPDADREKSSRPKAGKRRSPKEWIVSAGTQGPAIVQEAPGKSERKRRERFERKSIVIEVLGEELRVSSMSFMQSNALLWGALAENVRRECLAETEPASSPDESERPQRFVELYAGIGFFTIALARQGLSGVAIESDRSALSDLEFNLSARGLSKQVEIVRGRVESRRDLGKRLSKSDLLLVDPPRIGLETRVRDAIASDGPARLVYVSCDPATLARDLRGFAAAGYKLSSILAMDLFPQTPHVEVIARLDR